MKHFEVVLGIAVGAAAGWLAANYRADKHISELTKTMHTLAREREIQEKRNKELMHEHAEEISDLREVEATKDRDFRNLRKKWEEEQEKVKGIEESVEELLKQREDLVKKREELTKKVNSQKLQLDERQAKVGELEERIVSLQANYDNQMRKIDQETDIRVGNFKLEYDAKIRALKDANNELTTRLTELEKDVEQKVSKAFDSGFKAGQKAEKEDQAKRDELARQTPNQV